MNPRQRPTPFPWPTAWLAEYRRLMAEGHGRYVARFMVNSANLKARANPLQGEKCGAHTKSTGKPCRASAMWNGRCRVHGGLSVGARTPEGKIRALQNLKQYRHK